MSSVPSYLSEHQIVNLRRLLDDVRSGYVRVPRFQRPFVWSDGQRLELLNSIKRSMPVGSLLVWRTSSFDLKCFDKIGPYPVPAKATNTGVVSYLLDGHQRLTTLFGLLNMPPASTVPALMEDGEESVRWDVRYNLKTEEFDFFNQKQQDKDPLISLWPLLDNRVLSTVLRELQKRGHALNAWTDREWESYETRAYDLAYTFQEYKLPIVAMVTDDLELATTTFQRINSQGTSMNEAHLVAALTWTPEFDLREKIDELRKRLPAAWHPLDDKIYLQVCKGLLELDMISTGHGRLITELKGRHELLDEVGSRIARAITFLRKNAYVLSPELLPYSLQLLVLALELSEDEPSPAQTDAFLTWFWRSCWSGSFAGATVTVVAKERERLRELCRGDKLPTLRIEPLPLRMDRRQARARTFTLRLLANLERHLQEGPSPLLSEPTLRQLEYGLASEGTEALPRIVPRPRNPEEPLKRLLGSPANRRLPLGFQELEPTYDRISPQAMQAYQSGELLQFLELRMTELIHWDREQAHALFGAELEP